MAQHSPLAHAVDVEKVELGGVWIHKSIPALFQQISTEFPHEVCCYARGEGGAWVGRSLAQSARDVRLTALGLLDAGVAKGDRVGLISQTRREWGQVDHAILHLGAVTVGIYPTLTADEVAYQLEHAGVELVVVEDAEQAAKVREVAGRLDALKRMVVIDPAGLDESAGSDALETWTLAELCARGHAVPDGEERFQAAWRGLEPDDLATIIYTSGTTGPPKGAMLTHGNLCYTVQATSNVLPHDPGEVSVIFLPMAHSLQRVASYAGLLNRAQGYFSASTKTIMDDIREVRPTIQVSVPRIWEKLHARIEELVGQASPRRQRIFRWGLAVGREAAEYRERGASLPLGLRLRYELARRAVHVPLQRKVFGGRVRFLTSGGAPIGSELLDYFYALGLLVLEGWGLTETAAPATVNRATAFRFGTVGQAIPGCEVIEAEADKELLVRGPGVFVGYYRDEEATREAFTEDGFFRTGDIGEVDADGFVRITDRKKNIIVMANGKNVAPQNLENHFKAIPIVDQCLVVGDRRNYLTGLFSLDPEEVARWGAREGLLPGPVADGDAEGQRAALATLLDGDRLRPHVEAMLAAKNAELARFEQLKRWRVVADVWTQEDGSLTPTLKLKRRTLEQRYADLIEEIYAAPQ
jgi:long-chain acyl-CoA synthetase